MKPRKDGKTAHQIFEERKPKRPADRTPASTSGGKLTPADHDRIAALLVHGRLVRNDDGQLVTVYPSHAELAAEYGVARSMISYISGKFDCAARRQEEEERVLAIASHKITELRANAIAFDKAFQLETLDEWLHQFRNRLAEGKVETAQPLDYDRMVRLRAFVQGGADGRQEIVGGITMEVLAARHAAYVGIVGGAPAALLPPAVLLSPLSHSETQQALTVVPCGPEPGPLADGSCQASKKPISETPDAIPRPSAPRGAGPAAPGAGPLGTVPAGDPYAPETGMVRPSSAPRVRAPGSHREPPPDPEVAAILEEFGDDASDAWGAAAADDATSSSTKPWDVPEAAEEPGP